MSESTKSREQLIAELERKNAELEALLAAQSRSQVVLQAIIDASPSGLLMVAPDGHIEAASHPLAELFGLEYDQIVGTDIFALLKQIKDCFEHPAKFVTFVSHLQDCPDATPSEPKGPMQVLSRCLRTRSPLARDLSPFSWRVQDDSGEELGRLWLFVDVTHYRDSEERIHKVVEASPVPLIITRLRDGEILFANRELAAIVGATPEELVGRETPNFYHDPEDRRRVVAQLQEAGQVKQLEVRLKRADGSPFWAGLSLVITDVGGEPAVIGGVIDIDERKRIEEALRVSEARFRGLVENADDIIFSATAEGRLTYISPKFTEITGHEPANFLGLPLTTLAGTARGPESRPELSQATAAFSSRTAELSRDGVTTSEYRMKHKDGSWRWFVAHAAEIRGEDGEVMEIVGVAHDVSSLRQVLEDLETANTNLRQTQAQLVQSEKMAALGTLVAGIAHEINTPVGAISSMHDTLERAVRRLRVQLADAVEQDPKTARLFDAVDNACGVIDSGSTRVKEIVKRLRSFARLDEATLAEADIHEGIEDTLVLAHHELKSRILVKKDFGDIPRIHCFPSQLNQVFLNLIINASQAIPERGEIAITTRHQDGQVTISVRDSGTGIAEENLARVFDPGFTTKGVGVGTGLGLSICFQIAQAHHGTIQVQSEVGVGTTFTVVLPTNLEDLLAAES